MAGWTLAIDLGGSCMAVAGRRGDRIDTVAADLPSLVARAPDGLLRTGEQAVALAASHPHLCEPDPMRALTRSPAVVRLGGADADAVDLVAAVLAHGAGVARAQFTQPPSATVLTHPALWTASALRQLATAAVRAGLPEPRLVAGPVAVAAHYGMDATRDGAHVAVFDLGDGLDVAVLRRTRTGFALAGPPGRIAIGGADFDDALVELVADRAVDADPATWDLLAHDPGERWATARDRLRQDVAALRRTLSGHEVADLGLPGFDRPVRVTRPELEARLGPIVRRGVEELRATVERAGLSVADLAALYLAGGAARTPIVRQTLAAEFGLTPGDGDDPGSAVVLGALRRPTRPAGPLTVAPPPVAVTADASRRAGRFPAAGPLAGAQPPTVRRAAGWRPWRTRVDASATTMAYAAGRLYVGGGVVCAIDDYSGAVRWTSPPVPKLQTLAAAGDAVYGYDGGRVLALDAATGRPRWAYQVTGAVLAHPDGVLVGTRADVRSLDAGGRERWRRALPGEVNAFAAPGDGRLYAGTADGRVHALAETTGDELWTAGIAGGPGRALSPAVVADTMFVTTADAVWALDPASGEALWSGATTEPAVTVLATADTVYAVAAGVHAFAAGDGATRWRTGPGQRLAAVPSVGGGAVCGRVDGAIVCFDAVTGRPRWAHRTGAAHDPVIANGLAVLAYGDIRPAGTGRTTVAGVDLADGHRVWSGGPAGIVVLAPMVVADMVFLLVRDNQGMGVWAVDGRTGEHPDRIGPPEDRAPTDPSRPAPLTAW
ncbi:PQQ-binding-like beta-propeller repeat protein [Dactylosporangium cerinum]|uniref:PQQ-binding-like beta-propeller repeat protein n=1 Tax=Dactylosporangium cerinum TaxID=1434730 RepID=A0ABV9WCN8_9ACTN